MLFKTFRFVFQVFRILFKSLESYFKPFEYYSKSVDFYYKSCGLLFKNSTAVDLQKKIMITAKLHQENQMKNFQLLIYFSGKLHKLKNILKYI